MTKLQMYLFALFFMLLFTDTLYAQWKIKKVVPPWMGKSNSIEFRPSVMLMACDQGCLRKSNDTGQTWSFYQLPEKADIRSISIIGNSNIAIAVGNSGTLLRSIDTGNTWKSINTSIKSDLTSVIFNREIGICVGNFNGFLRTNDSGKTWQHIPLLGNQFSTIGILPNGKFAVASINAGLFELSIDGFSSQSITLPSVSLESIFITENGGIALFSKGTTYISGNNGIDWNISTIDGVSSASSFSSADKSLIFLAQMKDGSKELFLSGDSGRTWAVRQKVDNAYNHVVSNSFMNKSFIFGDCNTVAPLHYDNHSFTVLELKGIIKNVFTNTFVHSFENSKALIFAYGNDYLSRNQREISIILHQTSDYGESFESTILPIRKNTKILSVDIIDSLHYIATGEKGLAIKTNDGGKTWQDISPISANGQLLSNVAFVDSLKGIVCVGDNAKVLRTTDGGNHWTLLQIPLCQYDRFFKLCFYKKNKIYLYSINFLNSGEVTKSVYYSEDDGQNWEEFPIQTEKGVEFIEWKQSSADTILGVGVRSTNIGLNFLLYNVVSFLSSDGGRTWNKLIDSAFSNGYEIDSTGVSFVSFSNNCVNASGGMNKVLVSTNGRTWKRLFGLDTLFLKNGIGISGSSAFDTNRSIAIFNQGVVATYKNPNTTDILEYSNALMFPSEFYPNPCQKYCVIQIPEDEGGMDLFLYNLIGELRITQKITQMANRIDVGNLPNGVYVAYLHSRKMNITRIILIKN